MNTCECCSNESYNLQRPHETLPNRFGFCSQCQAILTQIPENRILELWENRTIDAQVQPTEDERRIVTTLWDRIPSGSSSWMSAFYHFLHWAERNETQPLT